MTAFRSGNPTGVPRNLSVNEVADIVRLRASGLTVNVIAERKNMSRESVAAHLAKHQRDKQRAEQSALYGRITPAKADAIESMRAEGHSQTAIAAALQLSQSQVSEYLTAKHRARFTQGHFAPTHVREPFDARPVWKPSKTLMEAYEKSVAYRAHRSLVE